MITYSSSNINQLHTLHLDDLKKAIEDYINDEVGIQNTSLGIRNQKCYAVKVSKHCYIDNSSTMY